MRCGSFLVDDGAVAGERGGEGSALDPGLSAKSRGRVVRAIAAGTHQGPLAVRAGIDQLVPKALGSPWRDLVALGAESLGLYRDRLHPAGRG